MNPHNSITYINGATFMFVIISRYLKSQEQVDEHYPAHAQFLEEYYRSGRFLGSGRMNPPVGGIILARGESLEEIKNILGRDPFAIHGCAQYEVLEFDPSSQPRR